MSNGKVMEPLAKKSSEPLPVSTRKNEQQKTQQDKYCGTCPVCQALKSRRLSSPQTAAQVLKQNNVALSANRDCAVSYLQENYGNSFTTQAFNLMINPQVPQPAGIKPDNKKIARAHAGTIGSNTAKLEEKGKGAYMDMPTRSFMESKMGHSFGDVKIHTDPQANKNAKNLNAHAYTTGNEIFFASGKYKPETTEGKKLLAHELTHVVQNKNTSQQGSAQPFQQYKVSSPTDMAEVQANSVAAMVTGSQSMRFPLFAAPVSTNSRVIYRQAEGEEEEKGGWLAEKASELASNIPGYTLLTVILGKNPITGIAVERNGKNLLGGVMGLIPGGAIIFKNLDESGAIDSAFDWVDKKIKEMNITWEFIKGLIKKIWDEVHFYYSFSKNLSIVTNILAPTFEKIKNFAVEAGKKVLEFIFDGALKLLGVPIDKLKQFLNTAGDAISLIVKDPIQFAKNLGAALLKGFNQFKDNIWEHLKAALVDWLFGTLAKAGIKLPTTWDLPSIFGLVMQILGLTTEFLRKKAAQVIGEKNLALLEQAWEFISAFIKNGISGVWELIKEHLGNLKETVFGAIQDWIVQTIVTKAVAKLVLAFNPVGGIITMIQSIYTMIKTFMEKINEILDLCNAVAQSALQIANGAIDNAANWIEKVMAKTLPIILNFLANFIGLGGISDKIKEIIKKLQAQVEKAVDKVINFVVSKVKGLIKMGKSAVGKVIQWWKQKQKVAVNGKQGSLSFDGEEDNTQLMISFSPKQRYSDFLKSDKVSKEPKDIYEQALKLGEEIDKKRPKPSKEPKEKEANREEHAKWVTEKLNALASLLEKLNPGKDNLPPSVITYGGMTAEGGAMITSAKVLSRNHPEGSEPADNPPIWKDLGDLRYQAPYYIQGHLLNHNLGGPGKRYNMTPITKQANSQHLHNVEESVKKWVSEGKVLSYTVEAKYEKRTETKRLNALSSKPEKILTKQEQQRLSEYKAEMRLATKFICTVEELEEVNQWKKTKKEGEKKIEQKVIPVENKIE